MIESVVFFPDDGGRLSPRAAMIEWFVAEGDKIAAGAALCRYEVDKAVAVIESPSKGYVRKILVPAGGRFTRGDVLALISRKAAEPLPVAPVAADDGEAEEPDFDWSEIDNCGGPAEPLGVMRRTIAQRMTMSKKHIPCFYLTVTVDMSACLERRRSLRASGGKATINDMVIKASALALARNPKVAAVFTPDGLVPRTEINIGFAAALPDEGLVVPVIRGADRKSLIEIATETRSLAVKAKRGELLPEDCSGGIFSVSYLGGYEVDNFIAIVNPGEAAIAAVGKTVDTPVVVDGRVVVRPVAKITMSSDHRSIDGALAAIFMGEMKRLLENAEEW